jgi:hypothetical protein
MIPEYGLNAEDVRAMMLNTMERHLTVKTEGYRCTTEQTFNLLLKAVAEGSSVEAVCADSCGAVDSNTLREQVNAALDVCQLRQQEVEMNAALAAAIPAGMPRGGLEVAIDTHDEPFLRNFAARAGFWPVRYTRVAAMIHAVARASSSRPTSAKPRREAFLRRAAMSRSRCLHSNS